MLLAATDDPLDAPVLEVVMVPHYEDYPPRLAGRRITGTYSRMSMRELLALGEDASDMDLTLYRLARDLRERGLFR